MMDFKKPYKLTVSEIKGETKITEEVALVLEGYALGLQDAMKELTGENAMAKHYDPLVIENPSVAKSYAFDLLDGGRTHDLNHYDDVDHITKVMLQEFVDWVNERLQLLERIKELEDEVNELEDMVRAI
jgi:hypothetical protein